MKKGALVLKPQDIMILLKLKFTEEGWTYAAIAHSLSMSASEVHGALERSHHARLYNRKLRTIDTDALVEFLTHGIRYAFPARPTGLCRGVPTAWFVPPLMRQLSSSGTPLVWPDDEGTTEGLQITPLYRTVPTVVRTDRQLYQALAIIDAIRLGDPQQRAVAVSALHQILGHTPAIDTPVEPSQTEGLIEKMRSLRQVLPQKLYESPELGELITTLDQNTELFEQIRNLPADQRRLATSWGRSLLRNPEHPFIVEEHLPRGPQFEERLEAMLAGIRSLTQT